MSVSPDDEIITTEGSTTREARLYHWFLDHLAKFPGRLTVASFAAAAAVTIVVVVAGGDRSPTTVVSLVATLWALFFAIMIYLLTARDTDKVLDQIADLREQLATALAAPDEDVAPAEEKTDSAAAEQTAATSEAPAVHADSTAPETGQGNVRGRTPDGGGWGWGDQAPAAGARGPGRDRRGPGAPAGPRLLVGLPAIADGVPSDLLTAWASATGRSRDELSRAWTRDPRADRQWVLETAEGGRWVVFSKGARGVGVMSLDDVGRHRTRRPPA